MSGGGNNQQGVAPDKLLTIIGDQPIGTIDGSSVRPTMYFTQLVQRIISYLGQPGSTSTASGTVSSQLYGLSSDIDDITNTVNDIETLALLPGTDSGASAALEQLRRATLRRTASLLPPASQPYSSLPTEVQQVPLALIIPQKPPAGQTYNVPVAMPMAIFSSIAGSQGYCLTTASGSSAIFSVAKISGGVSTSIGTVTFATAAHAPTFSGTGATFAPGDVLQLTAPASQNATLADIGITLLGYRQ